MIECRSGVLNEQNLCEKGREFTGAPKVKVNMTSMMDRPSIGIESMTGFVHAKLKRRESGMYGPVVPLPRAPHVLHPQPRSMQSSCRP